jgi:hypothetical protein
VIDKKLYKFGVELILKSWLIRGGCLRALIYT